MLQIPRSNSVLETLSNVKLLFDFYKIFLLTYEKLMRLKS